MNEPAIAEAAALSSSIGNFAELVAAGTAAPGGGSVSAYCGVLAASLGQMVANLTIGKQKYAEAEPRLIQIRSELEGLGGRLRELIAEDAVSFEAVLGAYRLPRDTDEQKLDRVSQIQLALRRAVDVPLETAQRSLDVLRLVRELADIGNPNALSDVAVGAHLAKTAIRGASYNVSANLGSMSDREAAARTGEQVKRLIDESEAIAKQVETKIAT
jgi:formiminotetrahydrofolate cyclodeaminase